MKPTTISHLCLGAVFASERSGSHVAAVVLYRKICSSGGVNVGIGPIPLAL